MGVADLPSPGVAPRRIAEARSRAEPWLASAAAPAAGASAAPAERLIVSVTGGLLSPLPAFFRVMTWSVGEARRDSERSKVGRRKVEEVEVEVDDEEAVVVVVDDVDVDVDVDVDEEV